MKRTAINHTKMRRLARRLGIKIWGARGIMESVWSAVRDEAPAGNIGKLSDEDIADFVGWDGDPSLLVQAMTESGWLDPSDDYRLLIHDWPDHCEDYIHARLATSGYFFANGAIPKTRKLNLEQRRSLPATLAMPPADRSAPVAAIPADESAPIAAPSAVAMPCHAMPSQAMPCHARGAGGADAPVSKRPAAVVVETLAFTAFWQLYPRHVKKREAVQSFNRAVAGGVDAELILAGLRRQLPGMLSSDIQYRPHPSTRLNGRRWEDEITAQQGTLPLGGKPSITDQVKALAMKRINRDGDLR